jgi:hypothetical protein
MAIELGNDLNVERTFERLSGVIDQHPTRTPVVLHWLPLVATRLHTCTWSQPTGSQGCQNQSPCHVWISSFSLKKFAKKLQWKLPWGCRWCLFVTYLSDHDRLNVAWTSLVFDGERQPVRTRACIHRKGNVLSSIFTWDPAPAHNVGSLSTVVSWE